MRLPMPHRAAGKMKNATSERVSNHAFLIRAVAYSICAWSGNLAKYIGKEFMNFDYNIIILVNSVVHCRHIQVFVS